MIGKGGGLGGGVVLGAEEEEEEIPLESGELMAQDTAYLLL